MKTVIVAAGMIVEQGRILVAQRKKGSSHGLLWEFPGGKVEKGEEPRGALKRELREELGIDAEVGRIVEAVFYFYPEFPILLLLYHCRIEEGTPRALGCLDLQWVRPWEMKELAMPPADEAIQDHLASLEESALFF